MISGPMSDIRCPTSCGSSLCAADANVLVVDDVGTQDIGPSHLCEIHP